MYESSTQMFYIQHRNGKIHIELPNSSVHIFSYLYVLIYLHLTLDYDTCEISIETGFIKIKQEKNRTLKRDKSTVYIWQKS